MKTKIIYISGSEVFNMADVRTAFDTVRRELGLPSDTILFGVPVDADDALGGQFESAQANMPVDANIANEISVEPAIPEVQEKPKRKKKISAKEAAVIEPTDETDIESIAPDAAEPAYTEPVVEPDEPVIPILSVLGGNNKTQTPDDTEIQSADDVQEIIVPATDADEPVITSTVDIDILDTDDDTNDTVAEVSTVNETEATDTDEEDPLAKLLQSVQSLNEDQEKPETTLQVIENTPDETDATLEKLANEFAENQDKIVNTTKSTARGGRIGKLKNILPFKKSKRNESSLMGDLFGWAGVAANDEEFAIPEFFPTAAKK